MIRSDLKEAFLNLLRSTVVGEIKAYAGSTEPSGWKFCDGSAVSRTDYAALFSVIGTTYGAGDGSTTFNLPDMRGRVPVGVGTGTATGATAHTLGQTAGSETQTLSTANLPAHTHGSKTLTGKTPHSFFTGEQVASSSNGILTLTKESNRQYTVKDTSTNSWQRLTVNATHEHASVGSGTAHNNMQPYIGLNFIIFMGG